MASHTNTIRPGEMTASQLGIGQPPAEPDLPEWVRIADHVFDRVADRLPGMADRIGKGGPIGPLIHIVLLWVIVFGLVSAFAVHIVGDGLVREKTDRTERLVEWLVMRALAEDRNEPPPPYPLL